MYNIFTSYNTSVVHIWALFYWISNDKNYPLVVWNPIFVYIKKWDLIFIEFLMTKNYSKIINNSHTIGLKN